MPCAQLPDTMTFPGNHINNCLPKLLYSCTPHTSYTALVYISPQYVLHTAYDLVAFPHCYGRVSHSGMDLAPDRKFVDITDIQIHNCVSYILSLWSVVYTDVSVRMPTFHSLSVFDLSTHLDIFEKRKKSGFSSPGSQVPNFIIESPNSQNGK